MAAEAEIYVLATQLLTKEKMMIKSYFVDGDKGGVGKSFASRCLVDSFINYKVTGMPQLEKIIVIDADPMNPDVVSEIGYKTETINSIQIIAKQHPIKSEDDWLNVINDLSDLKIHDHDNLRVVFSLPSAAGLYINESVMDLMNLINPVPIWVMGIDQSSIKQLGTRVQKSPLFYQSGYVLVNLKHGAHKSFEHWNNSDLRKKLLSGDDFNWKEIELPAMMPRAAELVGSTPFHTIVEQGSVQGSGIAIGTRTVTQSYRGIAGTKLADLEKTL